MVNPTNLEDIYPRFWDTISIDISQEEMIKHLTSRFVGEKPKMQLAFFGNTPQLPEIDGYDNSDDRFDLRSEITGGVSVLVEEYSKNGNGFLCIGVKLTVIDGPEELKGEVINMNLFKDSASEPYHGFEGFTEEIPVKS